MNEFWSYARRMLYYRWLIALAIAAAMLDAACAFGGITGLLWVVEGLFKEGRSVRDVIDEALLDNPAKAWLDPTPLLAWVPGDPFWGLASVLGVIVVLAVVGSIARYTYASLAIEVTLRTVKRVRAEAFNRLLHVPISTLSVGGVADNLSRVVRDSAQLARGLNAVLGKAVRDVLMGGAFLLAAVIINWRLTLVFLIALPLIAVAIRKFGKRIRRASKKASRQHGELLGALQESLQGLAVVKVHGAEGYERRRFNTINRRLFKQEMRARTARALSSPVVELLALIGIVGVTLLAAWLVFRERDAQPADMVKVLAVLAAAGAAMRPLANLNNDLQEAAAAASRVNEVLDLPVEPNTPAVHRQGRTHPLPPHRESIRFREVRYTYPGGETPAVADISLTVEHGQSIAIVGPNGSGKTTLLSMLTRLIDPDSGTILIDGIDISDVSLRSLRDQVAVVTQRAVLFEGTIADNIAYGRRHRSREAIIKAAQAAFADEFIRDLPRGYDTGLREGGAGLSGGQQQRLCIARAVLRDPRILILDEATSQIDADSEAKIAEALSRFQKGRTTFTIAHRLSTVVHADRIVVMAAGGIVDVGTHEELQARCGVYQLLTRTQLAGGVDEMKGATPDHTNI